MAERDVVWFVVTDDSVISHDAVVDPPSAHELNALFVPSEPAQVLLIGKDGGVKHRAPELDIHTLHSIIDAMPMRQREMAERD